MCKTRTVPETSLPTYPLLLPVLRASFSVLHSGRRVPLSGCPPWLVKRTSVANVMRAIHLEKSRTTDRWRTRGPRRPSNCHTQGFQIYPLQEFCVCSVSAPLRPRVYCRYKIHGGGHRRGPAETAEGLQRNQYHR